MSIQMIVLILLSIALVIKIVYLVAFKQPDKDDGKLNCPRKHRGLH